jgi:hypothetical protein
LGSFNETESHHSFSMSFDGITLIHPKPTHNEQVNIS